MPLGDMNKRVGNKVGSIIGEVEEVHVDEEDVSWGKQLWIRVRMDLTQPIARGRIVSIQGKNFLGPDPI